MISARTRRLAPAAAVLALVLAACTTPSPEADPPRDTPPSSTPAGPPATPSPTPDGRFTMAFAGDVHFIGRTRRLLDDPATAIGPTAPLLRAADVAMLNLETAVTERGTPEPKEFHFRAPATAYAALREAGVDVTTLANNHVLDYGQVGLADTLAAARASRFPVVGAGVDADAAWAPWITEVRGVRVAVLGLSQIRELAPRWTATASRPGVASALDVERSVAAVRAARARAAVVVVYVHMGEEGNPCPTARMRTLAAALAAAGADAVVSAHAHVLVGDGYRGPTYVAYGLGNFVWWQNSTDGDPTGVLTLTFAGRRVVQAAFAPARIASDGRPVPATGDAAARATAEWAGLRRCTGLATGPAG